MRRPWCTWEMPYISESVQLCHGTFRKQSRPTTTFLLDNIKWVAHTRSFADIVWFCCLSSFFWIEEVWMSRRRGDFSGNRPLLYQITTHTSYEYSRITSLWHSATIPAGLQNRDKIPGHVYNRPTNLYRLCTWQRCGNLLAPVILFITEGVPHSFGRDRNGGNRQAGFFSLTFLVCLATLEENSYYCPALVRQEVSQQQ